jgi:hypothetical protein
MKPKLPITSIPDMRFEQSYLASVRGFVHEYHSADDVNEERRAEKEQGLDVKEHDEAPGILATRSPSGEPELWLGRLRIQWCVRLSRLSSACMLTLIFHLYQVATPSSHHS